jgi:4-amino-4-deoxy-L-arabinose transferase-like glycosyltransferase
MKWFRTYGVIVGIVLFAALLRLWQLGLVPISPDWDEAALGYNAYSILKTGRDEYGTFLPRVLRSFDDYKPPLYTYLAIPSVAIFGLNTWAVRLPSAICGILTVLGTYLLVTRLFEKEKRARLYGLIASFLLAISPWHLQFSRIAFEANIGLTLNVWGLYALLRGLHSRLWMGISAFLFGAALYAYHSERIFAPLLVLAVVLIWKREVFADRRRVLWAVVIGVLTILPLIPVMLDKTSLTRLQGTSSISDKTGLLLRSVGKLEDDLAQKDMVGTLFENRRVVYAQKIVEGYISHFSFRWLFLTGDNDRHHAPDNGLLYLWEFPFILAGMYVLYKKGGSIAQILFVWFFIAPLAASPTNETPHAIRTLVFLPLFQIFTSLGVVAFYDWIRSIWNPAHRMVRQVITVVTVGLVVLVGCNIFYYVHMYFGHMNHEYSRFWQYGYAQAVEYAQEHKDKYQRIVVSTKLEQPHMFFLFYTKYDPVAYLAHGGTATGGFAEIRNAFDIYQFRPIDWEKEKHDGSTLYIGTPSEILSGSQRSIYYLNGEEAMRIAE